MSQAVAHQHLNRKDQVLAAIAVSIFAGLMEWGKDGAFGYVLSQTDSSRTLVSIIVVYGFFGLFSGLIAAQFSRTFSKPVVAVALVPAVLLGLAVSRITGTLVFSLLYLAAGLALGWLSYFSLKFIAARHPGLCRPEAWWIGWIPTRSCTRN